MSGLKRNRLFWFWLSNLHRTGDEVSHGSGALLQYQFRRPMNTPLSRGSQERGDPASPGQVEAGYGQAPRQTVSAAAAGVGLGTGENDPWMRYLNKQREEQARQQGATSQSTGNSSLSGGCVGQGLGQNGGCWQQGFVTQQGVSNQGFSQTGAQGFGGLRYPACQNLGVPPPGLDTAGAAASGRMVTVRGALESMNQQEMQLLLHEVSQRLGSGQRMFVPERLGQAAPGPSVPGFVRPEGSFAMPGAGTNVVGERVSEEKDAFSRSEKWLGSPPSPGFESWRSREDEILGMNHYLQELVSWANQGSVDYGREIAQAARWHTQIDWTTLTRSQQTRGVRLFSVLKAAFNGHGRISLLIQGFSEGLDIVAVAQQGDLFGNATTYMGNGFELLRQLCREFSLRNKSEAVSLRASLMQKSFHANAAYGAPVADTVRQIEVAVARYLRLISTLVDCDVTGLGVSDSDQLTLLIRSLPEAAKQYTLHHSTGESFSSYRSSALRWEHQQRLFLELNGSKKLFSLQGSDETAGTDVTQGKDGEVVDPEEGNGNLAGLKGGGKGSSVSKPDRCERCGKKGHERSQCSADMSKTKCFKCGEVGHISANCRKGTAVSKDSKSGGAKGSGTNFSQASKGKGKGGKKGKMYAIFDEDSGSWWYCDVESGEHEAEVATGEGQETDVMVLAGLVACPSVAVCNVCKNEPNTRLNSGDVPLTDQQLFDGNLNPLLQSLGHSIGDDFWLVDSGASCCVINQSSLSKFAHDDVKPCGATFTAANGTPVAFVGKCNVVLKVQTLNSQGVQKPGIFKVPVMVGDTPYNILSTFALGKLGWKIILNDGIVIENPKNGLSLLETVIWCDTPWLKVKPHFGKELVLQVSQQIGLGQDVTDDFNVTGHVCGIDRKNRDELEIHRAKGHMPFHADCSHCVKAKGVSHHRRRVEKNKLQTEIQADFVFISMVGETVEVFEGERESSLKVLALKEMYSSSIGVVVMTENVKRDRDMLVHWLSEFGLLSSETSITLLTDAEQTVQSFVTGCSEKFDFLVRKAAPQNHESVGGVERVNRLLREQLAVLQSEFQSLGYTLVFRKDILQLVLNYVCMTHNCFGKAHGGDRTPREMVSGGRLPQQETSLFGSRVHAEVPDSVRRLCPNMPRFVDAAFLQPQFQSQGSLVFAYIRVGDELVSKIFVAKSIKLVFPLEIMMETGMFSVLKVKNELGPRPEADMDVTEFPRVLPKSQGASLKCPATGPPIEFLNRFGTSKDCSACRSLETKGTRQGLTHSKTCCSRYERWLRVQISGEIAEGPAPGIETVGTVDTDKGGIHPVPVERALNVEDVFGESPTVDFTSGTDSNVMQSESQKGVDVVDDSLQQIPSRDVRDRSPRGNQKKRVFTRHCPSCESGMDVPGIRHSRECNRRNQQMDPGVESQPTVGDEPTEDQLDAGEVELPMNLDSEAVERSDFKRASDTPIADLELEIKGEVLGDDGSDVVSGELTDNTNVVSGDSSGAPISSFVAHAFSLSSYVPLLSGILDSVQFDARATSVVVPFGDWEIRIWEPKSAVDDSTLGPLPGNETLEGMKKEVEHLNSNNAGDLYTAEGIEKLKKDNPNVSFRIITCRWVTTRKSPGVVRARIVVKDVAGKSSASARCMGISSPTPSADALFLLLGQAGLRDAVLGAADVAHAFMATPLQKRDVIIRLPLSISSLSGEALYMHLGRALNGLRIASLEWVSHLSGVVAKIGDDDGLKSCSLEPCLFTGMMKSGPCALLVYVDDLLVMAAHESDVKAIFDLIGEHVTLKHTGLIRSSVDGGGQLKFLGRIITRKKGEKSVCVSIPSDYLDSTFQDFGLKPSMSSGGSPPDVAVHVEKENGIPLSPEAHTRFRAALGRVAWLSQTRQDLRAYVSILACQQSCPTNHTEQGMRCLLRFLKSDMCVAVRLPVDRDIHGVMFQDEFFKDEVHLLCYSDASHAPLRTTKRRGISGGVLTVDGSTIRTLSRHQQSISLSSMESELFAIQTVAQEMSSLGKICARALRSFQETTKQELPGVLYTDSESALKLLRNMDVPKRSRHLEIRIEWLKGRVAEKALVLAFRKGVANPSDMLTKCLGSSQFGVHRESLGFEVMSGPLLSLTAIGKRWVFVEVCCQPGSAISLVCKELGVMYCGITRSMEVKKTFVELCLFLDGLSHCQVFVHVSSPCSSGSPLRNFSNSTTETDWQWFEMFPCVLKYLRLGNESSFELPWNNKIWGFDLCQQTLKKAGHGHYTGVKLCQTGAKSAAGNPIGKTLCFSSTSVKFVERLNRLFSKCNCSVHATFLETDWAQTAFYNRKLAKAIVLGAQEALTTV